MAISYWLGKAKPVAQVNTITPANVLTTNTFSVTINEKTITFTSSSNTVAHVTAGLTALLQASTIPEFTEINWTDSTTHITATGATEGIPFTQTSSASGGTATNITATTTACSGPNFADVAANWSSATLPVDGDTIILMDSNVDILYGLANGATTPAAIKRYQSYTGQIGLPATNENGYPEYRNQVLTYGASADTTTIAVDLGLGEGAGPGLERWSFGTSAATVNIYNTGTPDQEGQKACQIQGTGAIDVNVNKGSVALAQFPGETCAVDDINIGYVNVGAIESDVDLYCGPDCTLDAVVKSGGRAEFNSLIDGSLLNNAGDTYIYGTGNVDQLTITGGRVFYGTTGTLGGATVVTGDGVLSFAVDQRAKTVTNPINVYGERAGVLDPFKVVSSLVLDLEQAKSLANMDIGVNVKLTRATPT
jgi:trimeric autotransporter adhesin